MILTAMAAVVAFTGPLDLELSCPGQYADVEVSQGASNATVNGEVVHQATTITTPVMVNGTGTLSLHGGAGAFTYPDGRKRDLVVTAADATHISAQYVRRMLLIPVTWKVEVSRLTGDIRITSGGTVGFAGTCALVSTQPKF